MTALVSHTPPLEVYYTYLIGLLHSFLVRLIASSALPGVGALVEMALGEFTDGITFTVVYHCNFHMYRKRKMGFLMEARRHTRADALSQITL